MKIEKLLVVGAAVLMASCTNLSPNQRAALSQAESFALKTAVNVGLSYATGGGVDSKTLIVDSIQGGAQILRSLIGTPAASNPEAVTNAVAAGSVSPAVDTQLAPKLGPAVESAIQQGAPPGQAVEAIAKGLDAAAAALQSRPSS